VAAVALDHPGQQGAGHVDQPGDVGRDHLVPARERRRLRRVDAAGEPGVVDQHVHFPPAVGQAAGKGGDGCGVGDVELDGVHRQAELLGEGCEAVGAARARDDAMAVADEPPGHRGAETGGGAGDEDRATHATVSSTGMLLRVAFEYGQT
jgi:hypothetical protein